MSVWTVLLVAYVLYALSYSVVMARRGFWSPPAGEAKPSAAQIQRVLVIGATGGTGRELVKQALEFGYEVTALARDPAKLTLSHPRLKIVRGDVLEPTSLEAAVRGQDAVLSALGHRRLYVPSTLQSEGTRNALRAMETHGVRRFVCETAIGLGNSAGRLGLFATFFFIPLVLPIYFWDKSRQEQVIAASALDWIIVRPGALTNGARRGVYRHGVNVGSYILTGMISRADVADFMLRQLTDDRYVRRAPAIVW
ncbi:MAG TPA: SDR family oxidoreductase [Chthoniobacterales bacterium]|nr:SDR family oxidoreductase [Chthoniobacterales bacterium]